MKLGAITLFLSLIAAGKLHAAQLEIKSGPSERDLSLSVTFEAPASYLAGAPSSDQLGLLIPLYPHEFEVVLGEGKKLKSEISARNPIYPCRCDQAGEIKSARELQNLKNFEVKYLGDFRGTPLTKVLFREGELIEGEWYRQMNLNVVLKSLNGKKVEIFETDKMELPHDLVIVTPAKFVNESEVLAQVERDQGRLVEVYKLEDVGNNFWDLKRSLKKIYEESKMGHVLFVGGEDNFPTEFVQTSTDFQTPSDLQYFLMGDSADRLPDVFGARLAISTAQEILAYAKKLERYYQKLPSENAIMVASREGANPSDVEYVRQMAAPLQNDLGLMIKEVLEADTDAGPEYLALRLDEGASWLNYIGHGSGYSWPSLYGGEFDLSHIKKLNAQNETFVLVDVACQNGRFKNDGRLGMEFISHGAGAVAFYGGSVDISWHPPAIMAVAINEDLALNQDSTLGEHILRGQLHLIKTYDDLEAALENLVWYHLQGVPTLVPRF